MYIYYIALIHRYVLACYFIRFALIKHFSFACKINNNIVLQFLRIFLRNFNVYSSNGSANKILLSKPLQNRDHVSFNIDKWLPNCQSKRITIGTTILSRMGR